MRMRYYTAAVEEDRKTSTRQQKCAARGRGFSAIISLGGGGDSSGGGSGLSCASAEPVMIIISHRRGEWGRGYVGRGARARKGKPFFFGHRLCEKIFSRLHVVAVAVILVRRSEIKVVSIFMRPPTAVIIYFFTLYIHSYIHL